MNQVVLTNKDCKAVINYHGAELKSLIKGDREYMWCADPKYWARTAPVLFPFVGAVNNGEYIYNGEKYPMGQHGFARDMDFELSVPAGDVAIDASEIKLDFEEGIEKNE